MAGTEYKVDMKAALEKSAACLQLHKAAKKQATAWAADSVKALKRSALKLKASGTPKNSSSLSRNIAFTVSASDENWDILIGTGVGRAASIKYARIQDKGGVVKPVKGKYLTIPFRGVVGTARMIPKKKAVFLRTKGGSLILCEKQGKDGLTPKFTLVRQVTLPPTYWFTQVMSYERNAALSQAMSPEAVFEKAKTMVK